MADEQARDVHAAARDGFAAEADAYSRGRPDYPAALLGWLGDKLGLAPGKAVLDLGAGTGKFTRMLLQTGAAVTAVEPVDAMRAKLATSLSTVTALAGTAETLPLEDATVDAVVCAQAFHWFATEAALVQIRRVLKPGGVLGLVWNVRDQSVDWVAAITRIIEPYEGDAPRFHKGDWRRPFAGGVFDEPQMTCFAYRHVGSAQEVIIDRFLSVSFIAALPASEKVAVEQRLRRLVATHADLRGRDEIAFPYLTQAYFSRPAS